MSGHTSSLTHVARTVLAGAVIGFGALATAGQASADPVRRRRCRASLFLPDSPCWKSPRARPSLRRRRHQLANRSCRRSEPAVWIGDSRAARWASSGTLGIKPRTPTISPKRRLARCPRGGPPPPGAAPAPQLPPGYVSLTDPESNGPPATDSYAGGPPLPPGYYPLNGPPPPPEYLEQPAGPVAPPGMAPIAAAPAPVHATNLPPE